MCCLYDLGERTVLDEHGENAAQNRADQQGRKRRYFTDDHQNDEAGWYEEFKAYCEERILDVLEASIFPGIKNAVLDRFSSTPLTIAKTVGTTDGAITGWAFTNATIPAENRLPKILSAIRTPIPGIPQAGQWTFSPSGLPTSILTGKLAADEAAKAVRRAAG